MISASPVDMAAGYDQSDSPARAEIVVVVVGRIGIAGRAVQIDRISVAESDVKVA